MYQTSHCLYTLRHFIRRFHPGSQHNPSLSSLALLLIIAICISLLYPASLHSNPRALTHYCNMVVSHIDCMVIVPYIAFTPAAGDQSPIHV